MIHLFDVTKSFGPEVVALRNVTLRVRKGELVLITGPSGAGKTTLLRTIFAATRPEEGEILLAGRNISRLRPSAIPYLRRNIGVVFQDFKLLRARTAVDNVAITLEIRGLPAREVAERSRAMLDAVGLTKVADTPAGRLSGGEQQRVAIARAVVGEPAILLADEPTGNLDPERSRDILRLIDDISETKGTTVLIATHDPAVVEHASSTRLVNLDAGRVVSVRPGVREPVTDGPEWDEPEPAAIGLAPAPVPVEDAA